MTTSEERELMDRLEESDALDRALAGYVCGSCGAHYPKAFKKMNGESDRSYAMRYVRCRFCGATGKVFPAKKRLSPSQSPTPSTA